MYMVIPRTSTWYSILSQLISSVPTSLTFPLHMNSYGVVLTSCSCAVVTEVHARAAGCAAEVSRFTALPAGGFCTERRNVDQSQLDPI
ncbi:unnamed protein product [Boreogadus saida]